MGPTNSDNIFVIPTGLPSDDGDALPNGAPRAQRFHMLRFAKSCRRWHSYLRECGAASADLELGQHCDAYFGTGGGNTGGFG